METRLETCRAQSSTGTSGANGSGRKPSGSSFINSICTHSP